MKADATRSANVLKLVRARPMVSNANAELVALLEGMLRAARADELTGLAFCTFSRERIYTVNIAGAAADDLLVTRGLVCELGDEVSRLNQDRALAAPTHPGY